jgi:hypothetical protein
MSEIALERRVRRVEGCVLAKILYQRAPFCEVAPLAWSTREPHPVEAAYVETDTGRIFRIFWADEFHLRHGFGVSLKETRVIDRDLGPLEDLSTSAGWRELVGQRMTASLVHWQTIEKALRSSFRIMVAIHADHVSRWDYPETIELGFEGGQKRYFSAAALRPPSTIVRFTNHLLISETL